MDNQHIFLGLLLYGFLGLIGQGVRAIVGLGSSPENPAANQKSVFNATYLLFTLMIGFIAGFLVGLINFDHITETLTLKMTLGVMAAGYAGADFVENTYSRLTGSLLGVAGEGQSSVGSTSSAGSYPGGGIAAAPAPPWAAGSGGPPAPGAAPGGPGGVPPAVAGPQPVAAPPRPAETPPIADTATTPDSPESPSDPSDPSGRTGPGGPAYPPTSLALPPWTQRSGSPAAEPVDAAVFCAPRVACDSVFLVQVFLYSPPTALAVEAEARRRDPTAAQLGSYSLPIDVPPGTRIDVRLEMSTLTVEEPDAVLVWRGMPTAAQFEVSVPARAVAPNAIGRVRFAIEGVPAGTLRFQVALAAPGTAPDPAVYRVSQSARYRRAFVSYSSQDRAKVLARVQAFKIAGMSVFQDILDLDPGERWEKALYREIDHCDVFLLFWSKAASDSEWVGKEIDYALERQCGNGDNPPAIQPVPIETPLVPPPPRLSNLHFNDALIAQIAAASAPGE